MSNNFFIPEYIDEGKETTLPNTMVHVQELPEPVKLQVDVHATIIKQTTRQFISPEHLEGNLIDHQKYVENGTNSDLSMTPQLGFVKEIQKRLKEAEDSLLALQNIEI